MKSNFKKITAMLMTMMIVLVLAVPVLALNSASDALNETEVQVTADENATALDDATMEDATEDSAVGDKAMAAAIAVGLAAAAGAIGMGWAIAKSAEGISRQPEAEGKIRTTLMLGLVFIETAIIYALVIAILIIFVL